MKNKAHKLRKMCKLAINSNRCCSAFFLREGAGFLPLRSQWEDIWQCVFFVTQEYGKNWGTHFGKCG